MRVGNDPLIQKMQQFLDLAVQRQKLISSNLANLETPGYRAKDLNFEEVFRNQMEAPLRTSRPQHLRQTPLLLRDLEIREVTTDQLGNDGNNVDLDRELTKLAENVLKFSAVAQLMAKKMEMLRFSIREGRV